MTSTHSTGKTPVVNYDNSKIYYVNSPAQRWWDNVVGAAVGSVVTFLLTAWLGGLLPKPATHLDRQHEQGANREATASIEPTESL